MARRSWVVLVGSVLLAAHARRNQLTTRADGYRVGVPGCLAGCLPAGAARRRKACHWQRSGRAPERVAFNAGNQALVGVAGSSSGGRTLAAALPRLSGPDAVEKAVARQNGGCTPRPPGSNGHEYQHLYLLVPRRPVPVSH